MTGIRADEALAKFRRLVDTMSGLKSKGSASLRCRSSRIAAHGGGLAGYPMKPRTRSLKAVGFWMNMKCEPPSLASKILSCEPGTWVCCHSTHL
jgi:hypothetical protein